MSNGPAQKTTIEDGDDWRIPWGNVWATVARMYYLVYAGALFFRMLGLIDLDWGHFLIAGTIPAVPVVVVMFVDGVWLWYVRARPRWKRGQDDNDGTVTEMGTGADLDPPERDDPVRGLDDDDGRQASI